MSGGPTHLCHRCAIAQGFMRSPPDDLISNEYQLEKYIKHTVPDARFPVASIFESTSTGRYRDFVVNAMSAGSVEIDQRGRRNIVWAARRPTGLRYEHGVPVSVQSAIRVVHSTSTGLIHAFPDDETRFVRVICANCGAVATA